MVREAGRGREVASYGCGRVPISSLPRLWRVLSRYEVVLALMRDFPHLLFSLNGGITTLQQVRHLDPKP